jgi:DNA replication protein DnaC
MAKMTDDSPASSDNRRKVTHADLSRVNLGKEFWGVRTDRIQMSQVRELVLRFRKNIREMISTGSGLVFSGPPGVGKTAAAACILKETISAGYGAYFVTHSELKDLRFEKHPSLFGSGADGVTVRRKIDIVSLLVLDGFNDPFFTDNVFGPLQLEELLVRRNSQKLSTIMTVRSRLTLKQEKFSDLLDVISQVMFSVPMSGKNMRDADREKLGKRMLGGGDS